MDSAAVTLHSASICLVQVANCENFVTPRLLARIVHICQMWALFWPHVPTADPKEATDVKAQHALILFILLLLLCATSASALQYSIVDLGEIRPRDINDAGIIAGFDMFGLATWDYRTMQRTAIHDGFAGYHARINEQNHVVASEGVWTPGFHAVSGGVGINDLSQVVGATDGYEQAFLWGNGTTTYLPSLTGGRWNFAVDISNSGLIVGGSEHAAVTWQNGTITPLPVPEGVLASSAIAVSDNGIIAGFGNRLYPHEEHMLVWIDGIVHDAEASIGSGLSSPTRATDVNNSGAVVGSTPLEDLDAVTDARIWMVSTGLLSLNTLIPQGIGWSLNEAHAINNHGQIVGTGIIDNHRHGFLLNPVPEPSSVLALGSGLLALGGLIRRRRR